MNNCLKKSLRIISGYTLIEIMVALAVFAILATITSGIMYHVFDTRARVAKQAEQLDQLQLIMTLFTHDTVQFVPRSIRTKDDHNFPMFIGTNEYTEFTRGGLVNPHAQAQRSTLKRIAYLCKNKQLIRRSWENVDMLDRDSFEDKLLLDNLEDCFFTYMSRNHENLPEWHSYERTDQQHREQLPAAIQLTINPFAWGKMELLFILPEGLYAS